MSNQKETTIMKQNKMKMNSGSILISIITVLILAFLFFINTNMSFNWALRSNNLLTTGNIIHESTNLNGSEIIIFQTSERESGYPTIVHLTRNSIGLWYIDTLLEPSLEYNIISTGWIESVALNTFDAVISNYFEWHNVYYGNNAIQKISDDLLEFIPSGISVRTWQSENEFFIHLTSSFGRYDLLNNLDLKTILRENGFVQ